MSLDSSEWNLTSCPPEQHQACSYYEYARFSPAVTDAIKKLSWREREALLFIPGLECIALLCPEFPDEPWLKIDQEERAKRIDTIAESTRPYRLEMVVDLRDRMHKQGFPIKRPFTERNATYMPIRIDWTLSDSELLRKFEAVLSQFRPKGTEKKRAGRQSYTDYLRTLGARRLLDSCQEDQKGVTENARIVAAAKRATELIGEHFAKSGKAGGGKAGMDIYTDWRALRTAAKKPEDYLRKLFQMPKGKAAHRGKHARVAYFGDPDVIMPMFHAEEDPELPPFDPKEIPDDSG